MYDCVLTLTGSQVDIGDESVGQIGHGVGTAAITINREEYLQAQRDLIFDRNQLQLRNNLLHRRLAEYYKYVLTLYYFCK